MQLFEDWEVKKFQNWKLITQILEFYHLNKLPDMMPVINCLLG